MIPTGIPRPTSDFWGGFILVHCIGILHEHGVLAPFIAGSDVEWRQISTPRRASNDVITAVLYSLVMGGILEESGAKRWRLSPSGKQVLSAQTVGICTFLTRAYGQHFAYASDIVSGLKQPARIARDGRSVGESTNLTAGTTIAPLMSHLLKLHGFQFAADLGCGTGQILMDLAELFPERKFLGVDKDRACIKELKARALKNIHATVGDITDLNWKSRHIANVDCFFSFFTLHELLSKNSKHLKKFLRDMAAILGGRTLFVWEFTPPRDLSRLTLHSAKVICDYPIVQPYLFWHALSGQQTFTETEWEELFTEAGLKVEKTFRLGELTKDLCLFPMFQLSSSS